MALVVSIGRNIGTAPMGQVQWLQFQADTLQAFRAHTPAIYFAGSGMGDYEGEGEESFTLIGREVDFNTGQALKQTLRSLAIKYEQEAIAMTNSGTELAYS